MNKPQHPDEVMGDLWAVKDATAAKFQTVSAYFSHLLQLKRSVGKIDTAEKVRPAAGRR